MPFFLPNIKNTLLCIIENIDKLYYIWVIESFKRFYLFVLFDFVDVRVAMLHNLEGIFVTIKPGSGGKYFRIGALSFLGAYFIVLHIIKHYTIVGVLP